VQFFQIVSGRYSKSGMMLPTTEYWFQADCAASAITPVNRLRQNPVRQKHRSVEGFEVVLPNGEIIAVGSMPMPITGFWPLLPLHSRSVISSGYLPCRNGAYGIVTKLHTAVCIVRPNGSSAPTIGLKQALKTLPRSFQRQRP